MNLRDTYLTLSARLGERKRRLISLCVLAVSAMLVIFIGYSTVQFAVSLNSEQIALETINAANAVKNTLVDAETGQRGYIITGDSSYLRPYVKAQSMLDGELVTLRAKMRQHGFDDSTIENLAHAKMDELARVIQIRRDGGFEVAREYIMRNIGQQLMDEVRATTDDVRSKESQNIVVTTEGTRRLLRIMVYEMTLLLACLMTLILVPWSMVPPVHKITPPTMLPW